MLIYHIHVQTSDCTLGPWNKVWWYLLRLNNADESASIFCSAQNFLRGSLPLDGFQQKGDLVESDKYSEAKVGAFEKGGHISEVFPYQ